MAILTPEQRRPAAIDVDRAAGVMHIDWQDGHRSTYHLRDLRPLCPCAFCQGEMGRPGAVTADTVFTPQQLMLVDMQPVGHYAVQPTWGDGHDTGFFTYVSLRLLCPCAECHAQQDQSDPVV